MDEALPPDDEELARAGFRRVQAYIRTEQSKNALRKERHRKEREAAGARQINIEAPDDEMARGALRALAAAMKAGAVSAADVARLIERGGKPEADPLPKPLQAPAPRPTLPAPPDPLADELARLRRVLVAGGWRAWVVRRAARGGVGAATP